MAFKEQRLFQVNACYEQRVFETQTRLKNLTQKKFPFVQSQELATFSIGYNCGQQKSDPNPWSFSAK